MSTVSVYKLLERAHVELKSIDRSGYSAQQQELIEKLDRNVGAVVELAFLAGNVGEPQG